MTTNITKLKKPTKGTPPPVEAAPDPIKADVRSAAGGNKTVPLQVKIPEEKLTEFSELAAKKHGFKKGAKSDFFLDLLAFYKDNN